MHKIRDGAFDVGGQPGEIDYTARFVPDGNIVARGTTKADALAALAIEMRLVADEIDKAARKPR